MTTALGAKLMGVHMGQLVPIGLYTPQQFNKPGFGTPRVSPARRLDMKLVGIVEFNNQVIEDETDQLPTNVVTHPPSPVWCPTTPPTAPGTASSSSTADRGIASIEQALLRVLPRGAAGNFSVTAIPRPGRAGGQAGVHRPRALRAHRPDGWSGDGLTGLARHLRSTEDDRQIMRALGAAPATTTLDALSGMVIAIVAGSLLACAVAVALSPLSPLGPVRRVYHPSVLGFDWTVLGGGLALPERGAGMSRCHPRRPDHAPPACPASSSRPVPALPGRPGRLGARPALTGRHRPAPRPRAGPGPYCCTSPMGPGRGRRRRSDDHRHVDFQQQPEHFDLPTPGSTGGTGIMPSCRKRDPAPGSRQPLL